MTTSAPVFHRPNRLAQEKSPYLLQHAHNPVDWYPWGEEAFAKAKQEQKPIFLSIGYSTCHWCHVMERESFEDVQTAQLLNQWYVPIKVDREEHPDIDHIYLQAVMTLTGHGGWPLSVFLTPELKPFFGGTYFPPERRWQLVSFREVLTSVATTWEQQRQKVVDSAQQLTETLRQQLADAAAQPGAVTEELLQAGFNQAAALFDPVEGGFGSAPKFPRSHELRFLLYYWARTRSAKALEMVTTTLDRMARGGLYDHLGGGFHRYATDRQWLVPHFEKMLYDQALLARVYVEAFRATRRIEYAHTARGICEYVLRDLTSPEGGFYSAEDADSEGEEGRFYVWTPVEVQRALGTEDGALFSRFYGVTEHGNFEHATSILHVEQPLAGFTEQAGQGGADALAQRLALGRARLLELRGHRPRPHRDDKILAGWNGLMIAALAEASAALGEPRYRVAAERAAENILTRLSDRGRLLRRYRDGEARYAGTLEDYAFMIDGVFALYEAGYDPRWLGQAQRLSELMIERFWDQEQGGWFLRDMREPSLILRSKEIYDGATPSGNSVATLALLRLGRLLGDATLEEYGHRALAVFAHALARAPYGSPMLLCAADVALGPTREVMIAGEAGHAETQAMLEVVQRTFLPRAVSAFQASGPSGAALRALIPAIAAQRGVKGRPTAYVCERFACRAPVHDAQSLARLLEAP